MDVLIMVTKNMYVLMRRLQSLIGILLGLQYFFTSIYMLLDESLGHFVTRQYGVGPYRLLLL